jgi:hypothetical protein
MNVPIRNRVVGRILQQLLRQAGEGLITLPRDRIVIDSVPADHFLAMGVSVLYAQQWIGWRKPHPALPPTAYLTGSGRLALTEYDTAYPDNTDITRSADAERALIAEAIHAAYQIDPALIDAELDGLDQQNRKQ